MAARSVELVQNGTGRSIGEVLEGLRDDFPDISVSKIRFLESQGLINPTRTPSGYRQFSEDDVALLRWILLQQRDHYLPLKVIRRRLREGDGPGRDATGEETPAGEEPGAGPAGEAPGPAPAPAPPSSLAPAVAHPQPLAAPAGEAEQSSDPVMVLAESAGSPPAKTPAVAEPPDEAVWFVASPPAAGVAAAPTPTSVEELWPLDPERTYSRAELAREAGLDELGLGELESFGLLPPPANGEFGPEALRVAGIAAGFFAYGVEARHLRMYKSFAEREAAFLEQVVMPMLNSRRPGATTQAREALGDLARLGQALRLSLLRSALGAPPGD